ncbi:MAG TPA: hypothetical protein PK771_01780 [Spirochaetota bacterium]|nr:hypothetical protein [Spirochaetota bacterium]
MSITTKNGDFGFTISFLGKKVKKNSPIIKLSSAIDETVSFLGITISELKSQKYIEILSNIQRDLLFFSNLEEKYLNERLKYFEEFITDNEKHFDLKEFILPGTNKASALTHYSKALIRKTEIAYIEAFGTKNETMLKFLNRLSDFLFIIALLIEKE